MADHRPYVIFPNPVLRARAAELDGINDDVRAIWDEMLAAMYAMPGVGTAAPQLGVGLRLAVMDCSQTKDSAVRLANPRVVWSSEEHSEFEEASPNLPGASAWISRPAEVEVAYLDESGTQVQRKFDGLWATSVQHQIDHLEGKLFFDRLSQLKRRRLLEAHRKQRRKRAG